MTEYTEDKALVDAVIDVLSDPEYTEFSLIREHEVKVMPYLRVRLNGDGEDIPPTDDPVLLKKVTPLERMFIDSDYLLVVDSYAWKHVKSEQHQKALLHRGLMRIDLQVNDNGGVKMRLRKPDIVEDSCTVGRFGVYDDRLINFRQVFELSGRALVRQLAAPPPAAASPQAETEVETVQSK